MILNKTFITTHDKKLLVFDTWTLSFFYLHENRSLLVDKCYFLDVK